MNNLFFFGGESAFGKSQIHVLSMVQLCGGSIIITLFNLYPKLYFSKKGNQC